MTANSERDRTTNDVQELIEKWAAAEQRGDTTALAPMLAADFVGIGPLGFMLTKEQWLARYASGDLRYDSFALEEALARPYGDAAVVTGRQIQSGLYQGGRDLPPGGRVTLVWVRQNGRWLLAGWHLSPIAEGAGQ